MSNSLTSVHYFMLFSQVCESFYYLKTKKLIYETEEMIACLDHVRIPTESNITEISQCHHCKSVFAFNLYLQLRVVPQPAPY